jgi:uncharacterized protein YtpQ (UPF0354 family)
MGTTFLPVLVSLEELNPEGESDMVLDEFVGGLAVAYAPGPAYRSLLTWDDLRNMGVRPTMVRDHAFDCLAKWAVEAKVLGQPPVLTIAFGGWESCMVLTDEFWERLAPQVPGELIIGVPARDVVLITGSGSRPGLEKVRQTVDRIFYAGGRGLLSRDLLVWRGGWEEWP